MNEMPMTAGVFLDLDDYSLDTVKMFFTDAESAGFSIEPKA